MSQGNADSDRKVITYVIPCYNSADYMDRCIESLLPGGDDIEILIVDDGSDKDDTPAKADAWQARHPGVIRAIHQPNKGHGGAVNTGIDNARGAFLKVVDSDDWLDGDSADAMLAKLRGFLADGTQLDMLIVNYVYEHTTDGTRKEIKYDHAIPKDRLIGWDDMRRLGISQNLLMHSVVYRTQVLRDAGTRLPEHCFYVDNIFVYQPYPFVHTIYYLPVPLYRYFIGRDDQSINESVMVGRIDQHYRVVRLMIGYEVEQRVLVTSERLRKVRDSYLSMMMAIASSLTVLAPTPENVKRRRDLWAYLKAQDRRMYWRARLDLRCLGTNLLGRSGLAVSKLLYRIAQKIYKFS